jgi:hypothetical protein
LKFVQTETASEIEKIEFLKQKQKRRRKTNRKKNRSRKLKKAKEN